MLAVRPVGRGAHTGAAAGFGRNANEEMSWRIGDRRRDLRVRDRARRTGERGSGLRRCGRFGQRRGSL